MNTGYPGGAAALRVLLVEDNPFHYRLVSSMAMEAFAGNVRVDHVGSLEDALSHLERRTYDCVLLDLMLPDAVGLEGLHAILAGVPGIPVVVVSAHDDEDTAVRCVEEGAQEYLVKGIADEQQLKLAILHSIERNGRSAADAGSGIAFKNPSQSLAVGHVLMHPSGAITRVDLAACSMLGREVSDLVGSPTPVHPDDRDELDAAILAGADGSASLRLRFVGPNGEDLPADVQLAAAFGADGGAEVMMQVAPIAPVASWTTVTAPAEVGWRVSA